MTYKVFKFDPVDWLYCENVTLKDGLYRGHVINGDWDLMYDTRDKTLFACDRVEIVSTFISKLVWACNPENPSFDYNAVIDEAQKRFESGEEPNFEVDKQSVNDELIYEDDEEDDIPF